MFNIRVVQEKPYEVLSTLDIVAPLETAPEEALIKVSVIEEGILVLIT